MSKKNMMDQNRIDAMIDAALMEDKELLSKLKEMAERFEEPIDALAAFLVGKIEPGFLNFSDWSNNEEWVTLPCTFKQWKYFLERCRKGTKRANYKIRISDLVAMGRFARIGQWPTSIPHIIEEDYQYYPFMEMGWEAAWAWAWYNDQAACSQFLEGNIPFCEINSDGSWNIAVGLCDGLKSGLIKGPNDPVPFVIAYSKWYVGPGNANVEYLCYHGLQLHGKKIEAMSESALQALATCWKIASQELGKRWVPLLIPEIQLIQDWIYGVEVTVPVEGLEKDIETFLAEDNSVARYRLWGIHTSASGAKMVTNPDDPFGPEVNFFHLKTGQFDRPQAPTFEDALELIIRRNRE